jgi:hypothetical protein
MTNPVAGSVDLVPTSVPARKTARFEKGLSLLAAPLFGAIALSMWLHDDGMPNAVCSMRGSSPFSSMLVMYCLMCVSHAPPWFRFIRNCSRI